MNSSHLEKLIPFLVIEYLEKEGIGPQIRQSLADEFTKKGLFDSLIDLNGQPKKASYDELSTQINVAKYPAMKDMLVNQCQIQVQRTELERKKHELAEQIQRRYDIFNKKTRRELLRRTNIGRRGHISPKEFPSEMFTNYWNKLKSIFGHRKKVSEPDDPINGSPVYNLSYDKTGKYIISAADDGLIKIWSTTNGELVNTLIGHDADINATALSECGKYLASCSNHGLVRVWNLETCEPVAVFNDHKGTVCSLNFFKIPIGPKEENVFKPGLASASDDGNVKIYYEEDFVNNQGKRVPEQKHFTLQTEELPKDESSSKDSKGFSSIEFHPDGYMAAGTSMGSIIIWNKLTEINIKHIEKHRIIKKEHSRDCHLTLWNKEGTKLLSASFDGTAKIWPWNSKSFNSNRDMRASFVFEGDLGKAGDIKCCAVAWSCNGRYAITSFCKRSQRRAEENTVLQANIQVYDSKVHCRTHKFDKTYDNGLLENYIFILEPHPFNESILMSADYDGKVVIWNIDLGIILNCFIENCAHIGLPLLDAPILDGRFSPDGLNFSIASFYGSITLYGYGEKDLFLTTPTQQFFSKEFLKFEVDPDTFQVFCTENHEEMHLMGKGSLCGANKKEYPRDSFLPDDYLDFNERDYYKKYVEALDKQKHLVKQEIEGVNSADCLKALKARIQEIIQHEIQKKLHDLTTNFSIERGMHDTIAHKPIEAIANPIDLRSSSILDTTPSREVFALLRTEDPPERDRARGLEAMDMEKETREAIEKILLEDSQDFTPLTEDAETGNKGKRRRGRKSRAEIEESLRSIQREGNRLSNDREDIDLEEEEEDMTLSRRRGSQRRSNRLILDDDEDEEEKKYNLEGDMLDEEDQKQIRRSNRRRRMQNTQPEKLDGPTLPVRRSQLVIDEERRARENRALSQRERLSRRKSNQNLSLDEVKCSRCGLENARIKCTEGCGRVFHSICSKAYGMESEVKTICLFCVYQKKRKDKAKGINLSRDWLEQDESISKAFKPQVGDLVTYVSQAHEEFVIRNFDSLRFSKREVYPYERVPTLLKDNVCMISKINHQFPLNSKKHKDSLTILMKITLEVKEPQESCNAEFTVTYVQTEDYNFLIPRNVYLNSINKSNEFQKESTLAIRRENKNLTVFLSDRCPKEGGIFSESYWHSLKCFDHSEEGVYHTRNARREGRDRIIVYVSPWEVHMGNELKKPSVDEDFTSEFMNKLVYDLDLLSQKRFDISKMFLFPVDKKEFPTYNNSVPFEMNINKILSRLRQKYYRHKEAVKSDIIHIRENCRRFNSTDTEVFGWARELSEQMIEVVDEEIDVQALVPSNTSPVKTRSRRRKESTLDDELVGKDEAMKSDRGSSSEDKRGFDNRLRKSSSNIDDNPNKLLKLTKVPYRNSQEENRQERPQLRSRTGVVSYKEPTINFESLGEDEDKGPFTRKRSIERANSLQANPSFEKQEGYRTRAKLRSSLDKSQDEIQINQEAQGPSLARDERPQRRLRTQTITFSGRIGHRNLQDDVGNEGDDEEKRTRPGQGYNKVAIEEEDRLEDYEPNHETSLWSPEIQPKGSKRSNEKDQSRPPRLSNTRTKTLRKTRTMQLRNEPRIENDEGQQPSESDLSRSVGDSGERAKDKNAKRSLRSIKRTYTQYFDEQSDSESLKSQLEEDDDTSNPFNERESIDEEENGKEANGLREVRRNEPRAGSRKIKVIEGDTEQNENGEKIAVRRYNTRNKDKL